MIVTERGTMFAGVRNQTHRESSRWFATGRWRKQAVVWTVILCGLLAGMLWVFPAALSGIESGEGRSLTADEAAAQFADLAAVVTAVGVIILTQGILIDDRRSGVAEWILSKPLSRPALVVAKFTGQAGGLIVAAVMIPWVGVWILLSVADGTIWPIGHGVATIALISLYVLFHIALVLALNATTWSRGASLGIPLALLVGSDLVMASLPWVANVNPYLIGRLGAGTLATGELLATGPVIVAIASTIVLVALATWQVTRDEL